jgi:hypothetical protein
LLDGLEDTDGSTLKDGTEEGPGEMGDFVDVAERVVEVTTLVEGCEEVDNVEMFWIKDCLLRCRNGCYGLPPLRICRRPASDWKVSDNLTLRIGERLPERHAQRSALRTDNPVEGCLRMLQRRIGGDEILHAA